MRARRLFYSSAAAVRVTPAHTRDAHLEDAECNHAPQTRIMGKRTSTGSTGAAKRSKAVVTTELSVDEITELAQLAVQPKHYNLLVTLLQQYERLDAAMARGADDAAETRARTLTVALCRAFETLFAQGLVVARKLYDDQKRMVVQWIAAKYDVFKLTLVQWLCERDFGYPTSVQLDMLDVYMTLVRLEAAHAASAYFPTLTYKRLVVGLLLHRVLPYLVEEFTTKYYQPHWDLQCYLYLALDEHLKEAAAAVVFDNFLTVVLAKLLFAVDQQALPTFVEGPLPATAYKPLHFQSAFQRCVMAVLLLPLEVHQYKAVLLVLHKRVIPLMAQPQNLMDFLTDAYNVSGDGAVPVLALNSLYELMRRYNLEYPDFYRKLYLLLTPELLYTRYRSRFFRLCDLFLSLTHLSAALVASFIKKMARLALRSLAPGVVIVIPFVYNLMKRHPLCMVMLHRKAADFADPFVPDETDPLKTEALGSSLWELEALMLHYHPNIATLACIFGEPFRKHSYNMEDFLDWSYITLLDSEKTRKYRGMAALEYQTWGKLVGDGDNVYASGWTL